MQESKMLRFIAEVLMTLVFIICVIFLLVVGWPVIAGWFIFNETKHKQERFDIAMGIAMTVELVWLVFLGSLIG
jgi:heme/copper-type cytochrome/quinol oxidase subunit 2